MLLIIIGFGSLFFFVGHVLAQTATPSATAALSPTTVTSLPQTGTIQYAIIFFAVSIGIILLAFLF